MLGKIVDIGQINLKKNWIASAGSISFTGHRHQTWITLEDSLNWTIYRLTIANNRYIEFNCFARTISSIGSSELYEVQPLWRGSGPYHPTTYFNFP